MEFIAALFLIMFPIIGYAILFIIGLLVEELEKE